MWDNKVYVSLDGMQQEAQQPASQQQNSPHETSSFREKREPYIPLAGTGRSPIHRAVR